jgi:hypothetical protein
MASCGTTYIQIFMKTAAGVRAILRFCFSKLRGCNVWYYRWEGFMNYPIEMASCGMMYVPSCMTIASGIQVILRLLPQQFERLQCSYY